MAEMVKDMGKLLRDNIKDESLYDWIIPNFTTTTKTDVVTASALMMGAMQSYFKYEFATFSCGLPAVTLLGEKEDWEKILGRLDKLAQLGEETSQFGELLKPVLRRLVKTFDTPDSNETIDFWQRITSTTNHGSGSPSMSGWLTAFCVWDEDGRKLVRPGGRFGVRNMELDGQIYYPIALYRIPLAYISMPVNILDDFRPSPEDPWPATLIAGVVGYKVSKSGYPIGQPWKREARPTAGGETGLDTLQPVSGWWIFDCPTEEGECRPKDRLRGLLLGRILMMCQGKRMQAVSLQRRCQLRYIPQQPELGFTYCLNVFCCVG